VIEWSTAALRLGIALAFGVVIGVEREWRLKQAGLKTMSLVALGAAAFARRTPRRRSPPGRGRGNLKGPATRAPRG